MSPLLRLAANDVRLTVRDRAALFWLLLLPVFLTWLFGTISGGGGPGKISLTVLDRDGGWLARALIVEMSGPSVALDVAEGDSAAGGPQDGTARWLVIPPGFTTQALAGKQQRLKVETAEGAAADYSRAADVLVVRAIARTIARAAELEESGGVPDLAAYEALRARPRLVSLETSTAGHGVAVARGVAQSVPGIMTFTVLMMTTIYGAVFLTIEKRGGMLQRQMTLPVGRTSIFLGKILGRVLVALVQIAILIVAGRFLFRLDFGSSPAGLGALLLAYAFAVAGIATYLGVVLANPEQASIIGSLVSTVMAALGGCWWPAEVMPEWLRTVSHVFPTAWAMDGLHALISFGKGFDAVIGPCAALAGFGVLFSLLAGRWGNSAYSFSSSTPLFLARLPGYRRAAKKRS